MTMKYEEDEKEKEKKKNNNNNKGRKRNSTFAIDKAFYCKTAWLLKVWRITPRKALNRRLQLKREPTGKNIQLTLRND